MKFITGLVLGIALSVGASGLLAQRGEFHPRLARAIEALRDARAYMQEAPHDFGGHRVEAIRATDEAIKQLNYALEYRPR
jgi:hypothetical protein